MGQFDSQIAAAERLIAKNGQRVTIELYADVTPDPDKPWRTEAAPSQTLENVSAVFLDYEEKYIDGQEVHTGDQKALVAAAGLTLRPNLKGHIDRNGEIWKIVRLRSLAPNEQTILYTVQVRQ